MLTSQRVRELFDYDPFTGTLSRKDATKGYDGNREITRETDKGYLITTVDGVTYRVHQLVWLFFGNDPVDELDHADRDRANNRIGNLRPCTRTQNLANAGPKRGKYKGVSFCKQTGRWVAQIGFEYQNIKIGRFDTPEEAALAYNVRAVQYFGEFAFQNEVTL